MLIEYDPDSIMTIQTHTTCGFHQRNPGKAFAGCTCSFTAGTRKATPEEYRRNRLSRLRALEKEFEANLASVRAKLKILDDEG